LADLGLGSSAGGVCYLETHFPAEYRSNLFFCEWGRSVVRYRPERAGSGFAQLKEIEFAAGADNDPYGFKPTDLVVDHDGSLVVADWADGQQPKRGRGRIYRIRYVGEGSKEARPNIQTKQTDLGQLIAQLDSESYSARVQAQAAIEGRGREGMTALLDAMSQGRLGVRARLHAIWVITHIGGTTNVERLFNIAKADPDVRVQAQAIRAIADLSDPVLCRHRLDAGLGDENVAKRLAELGRGRDPQVLLETIIALGRLPCLGAPEWLRSVLMQADHAISHAGLHTLRQSGKWAAVLKLLDEPNRAPIRAIAMRAVAEQAVPEIVDGLIERLRVERNVARRREY